MKKSGMVIGIITFFCVLLLGVAAIEYIALMKNKEYTASIEEELDELEASAKEQSKETEEKEPGDEEVQTEPVEVTEPEPAEPEVPEEPETGEDEEDEDDEEDDDDDDDDDDESSEEYGVDFHTVRLTREDPRYADYAVEGNPYDELQYRYESMISYPTDIVFLGDSMIAKGAWQEFYPGYTVKNRGISGDTIDGVRARMDSIIATKPERIFLMIGVNDILFGKMASGRMEQDYISLLDEIRETGAEIYVMSILPVSAGTEDKYGSNLNDWIREANDMIETHCEEYGAHYIDVRDGMVDGSGKLREELTIDGIHLTGEGYGIWYENLEDYID